MSRQTTRLIPVIFLFLFLNSRAQNYPAGYFRNPLALPMSLAGNFGELRPNHYHMGLDLRTNKRINQPVYAAADGYISRIKIDQLGFGQAIYIDHPNGYTTVYVHLNEFYPALARYIKQQQYLLQSWELFLDFAPNQFPVTKGQLIAYSGNMGGSQAPHLHFEVRRTKDDTNLNPALFGFPLPDNTSPQIFKLAVYDRNKSTYEQVPKIFPVRKVNGGYTLANPLITVNSNLFSFAINAWDTHNGSSHNIGIYQAILFLDEVEQVRFTMDGISYDNTRYVNGHVDYKTKANGGPWLQHLAQPAGYPNGIYQKGAGDGVIRLYDQAVHQVRIEVKDAGGNSSMLRFQVQSKPWAIIPYTGNARMFYPLMIDVAESPDCEFYLGENCLYDSVHLGIVSTNPANPQVVSRVHSIGQAYIPVQDYFLVRIKPTRPMGQMDTGKVVMQRFAGPKNEVKKVNWQNGWAAAKFRDFGNFQLVVDNEPPQIVPLGFHNNANLSRLSQISFTVRDNLGEFQNFRAELDGKWICFTNDKGKVFIYRFDEHCLPGSHELKIHVEDEAGNVKEENYRFVR